MGGAVLVGLLIAVYAVALGGLWALAARVRRTGVGTGMLGPFDEIWHPVAVDARIEVAAADYRPVEAPTPADPPAWGPSPDA